MCLHKREDIYPPVYMQNHIYCSNFMCNISFFEISIKCKFNVKFYILFHEVKLCNDSEAFI